MAKNSTAGYDPRHVWAANLAPFVTAAREGAVQAARTASRERARVRHESPWWRRRWLVVTAAGLMVAGAAGGTYAALAARRSAGDRHGDVGIGPEADRPPSNGLGPATETGRGRMAEAARAVVHRVRGERHEEPEPPDRITEQDPRRMAPPEPHRVTEPGPPRTTVPPDDSRNQAPVAGSGHHRPL